MELVLWTDQRGIDSMHLGRRHIKNGQFEIKQTKTGKVLTIPIAPQLLEALIASKPKSDAAAFLLNELGRPFSRKGFGNKFRQWCDEAGLFHCSAHGLRKATLRRMAELKMPNKSMKSLSGHSKDDEITRYTEAANQAELAREAVEQLSKWESAPQQARDDPMARAAVKAFRALDRQADV
jgi:integrase